MANIPILSSNAGELSPKIDARSDIEKYGSGCRHLENMLPLIYGCAERRPGTAYIDTATDTPASVANTVVRVIPFIYSASVAYVVELGNKYAKFYYDGAALDDSGDVTISTPYLAADLFELHIKQRGDVLWITHSSYPPSQLTRTAVKTFVLEEIDFRKGPFLVRNDLIDPANPSTTTLAASSISAGSSGTLTASASIFQPDHVGALFMLVHPRTTTVIEQDGDGTSSAIQIKGNFSFNTHGTWTGTVKLQRNDNQAGWEDYRTYKGKSDRNIQLASVESEDNIEYRIYILEVGTSDCTADLIINDVYKKGIVKTNAYISSYKMSMTVYSAIEVTTATKRWYEGAWSEARGFPSCVTFYNDRCVYAGASRPLTDTEFSAAQYPSLRI